MTKNDKKVEYYKNEIIEQNMLLRDISETNVNRRNIIRKINYMHNKINLINSGKLNFNLECLM